MFGPAAPVSVGANLPWITYGCDFGANAWQPDGGLAARGVPAHARQALAALADHGSSLVRWFLFCDGRAGIRFDGDRPLGLDAHVIDDIDAGLALARACDVRVVFVLFDFHWCRRAQVANSVTMGGHRASIARPSLRAALIETVVAPVLARYASHPSVAAWDLVNEPEWVTFRLGAWNPFGTVSRRDMRAFIDDVAACGRRVGTQPLTVGLASAKWLDLVRDADLDFYQVHWYDHVEGGRPPRPTAAFGVDKPVVLGEFPTRGSAHAPERLAEMAAEAGYAAAWTWSMLADDGCSDRAAAVRTMHADLRARRRDALPRAHV